MALKALEATKDAGNPHVKIINALYAAFDHFNVHFYGEDDKLTSPVINLGPAGRRNALGWFRNDGWIGNDGETIHEINISPEYLTRDPDEILETLLHEMAHMRNRCNDITDCNASQYHNANFKDAAEMLGLEVEKKGYRGWAWTCLGSKAKEAIEKLPFDKDVFKIARPHHKKIGGPKYITIALKSEDWLDILEDMQTVLGKETKSGVVKELLMTAYNEDDATGDA